MRPKGAPLTFCRPLGVRWIGVANRHGGWGALPESYAARSLDFVRWRALKKPRSRVTEIYDDLTTTVNRMTSERNLHWRRLAATDPKCRRIPSAGLVEQLP